MTVFENWDELKAEIEDLFNNKKYTIMYKEHRDIYPFMVEIVKQLEDHSQKYSAAPKEFSEFIFANEGYKTKLMSWLPYLSGARAQLLEMVFYDQDQKKITDIEKIKEIVENNDHEITSKTFISIEPNIETLNKLSPPAKKLKM